jgi:hypothetical protein
MPCQPAHSIEITYMTNLTSLDGDEGDGQSFFFSRRVFDPSS